MASLIGNYELAELLIDRGAYLNKTDDVFAVIIIILILITLGWEHSITSGFF